MILPVLSVILTALGDILIGFAVLRVHAAITRERIIDAEVVEQVHVEKILIILGILFIFVGAVLYIYYLIS